MRKYAVPHCEECTDYTCYYTGGNGNRFCMYAKEIAGIPWKITKNESRTSPKWCHKRNQEVQNKKRGLLTMDDH